LLPRIIGNVESEEPTIELSAGGAIDGGGDEDRRAFLDDFLDRPLPSLPIFDLHLVASLAILQ